MRSKSVIIHRMRAGLPLDDEEIVWMLNWIKSEKERMRYEENFMIIVALILIILSFAI